MNKNIEWTKIVKVFPEANFLQSPMYGKMNEILGDKVMTIGDLDGDMPKKSCFDDCAQRQTWAISRNPVRTITGLGQPQASEGCFPENNRNCAGRKVCIRAYSAAANLRREEFEDAGEFGAEKIANASRGGTYRDN